MTYHKKQKGFIPHINLCEGFTMLEMIIVIFLVSFAIVGVYSAFSVLVILNSDSMNRLKATYLAQEGLEIMRNARDQNWNNEQTWLSSFTPCESACQVDYKTNVFDRPPTVWGQNGSYLDVDNGFYGYSSANPLQPTQFKRKITITTYDSSTVKVVSEVFWNSKPLFNMPNSQEIKIETVLYDWQ